MAILNSTIVITGGSSGIGLEMCRQFIKSGNKVITCSRSLDKLKEAQKTVPDLIVYPCDIANEKECDEFIKWINRNHPEVNVLINNAAIVTRTAFIEDDLILEKMNDEIATNFTAPVRLIKLFYPTLIKNSNSKIINITTGLVYAPRGMYTFYNATKSALNSFTQVLRYQLKNEPIHIIEVFFPVVNTPWHNGNAPKIAISPEKAVTEMMNGIALKKDEIRIAKVKMLYLLSRIAPKFAFKKINSLN
jgi:uncharacterized oxidoreductase